MNDHWADILLAAENYPDDKRESVLLDDKKRNAENSGAPQVD